MNICPAYMAMGMTWNQFWHCNTKVHRSYRLAWAQRKQYRNWEMWWQGSYIYEALLKVAPVMRAAFGKGKVEPGKYSEEPYPLTAKEAEERKQIQQKQRMERMLEMFKRESVENLRKREEEKEEADAAAGDEGPHPSRPSVDPPSPSGEGLGKRPLPSAAEPLPPDARRLARAYGPPEPLPLVAGEGFGDGGKLEAKGD